jgi:hypothetical protein
MTAMKIKNRLLFPIILINLLVLLLFAPFSSYAEEKHFAVYGYNEDPSYKTNHTANNNSIPPDAIFIKGESVDLAITRILGHLGPEDTIGKAIFRDHGVMGNQSVGAGIKNEEGKQIDINIYGVASWGPQFDRLNGKWGPNAEVYFTGCNVGAGEAGANLVYEFANRVGVPVKASVNTQYAGKQHEYNGPWQEAAPGEPKPEPIEPTDIQNPNDGAPELKSIPTLSEWKQIFLTLIMLSLVMGFMRKTHPKAALSNGGTMLRITDSNFLAFNRHIYTSALKWVGVVVLVGLAGVAVVSGHLKMVDLLGTLFCAPLVAYILHLIISFIHDFEHTS